MRVEPKNLLITGLPGAGKTTLVKKVAGRAGWLNPVGFFTEEIREQGVRKGFALVSLDGCRSILSHESITGSQRVGKYGVDVAGFDSFLDAVDFTRPAARLVIIDEIGKMELLSEKFRNLLQEIMDGARPVVATIARKGTGFIETTKRRRDSLLLELTVANREALLGNVDSFIRRVAAT
jgi:nucleoside-triphosphatase